VPWWLPVLTIVGTTCWLTADEIALAIRERCAARRRARYEPIDAWIIELDGDDIGLLVQPQVTDMFWKQFVVVGDDARLFDNTLWEQCRFRYRHAWSGRRAEHAFCGGLRPTRDAPHVTMRGLY